MTVRPRLPRPPLHLPGPLAPWNSTGYELLHLFVTGLLKYDYEQGEMTSSYPTSGLKTFLVSDEMGEDEAAISAGQACRRCVALCDASWLAGRMYYHRRWRRRLLKGNGEVGALSPLLLRRSEGTWARTLRRSFF